MVRFFIPKAKDRTEAEEILDASRRFIEKQGCRTTNRRIQRLEFTHNGKAQWAEVGKRFSDSRVPELVIAIFEGHGIFYVCTPNRGVVRGDPILVGPDGARVTDFDPDHPGDSPTRA